MESKIELTVSQLQKLIRRYLVLKDPELFVIENKSWKGTKYGVKVEVYKSDKDNFQTMYFCYDSDNDLLLQGNLHLDFGDEREYNRIVDYIPASKINKQYEANRLKFVMQDPNRHDYQDWHFLFKSFQDTVEEIIESDNFVSFFFYPKGSDKDYENKINFVVNEGTFVKLEYELSNDAEASNKNIKFEYNDYSSSIIDRETGDTIAIIYF
jgi:hypothetical protein